jgi:hypothetical protein
LGQTLTLEEKTPNNPPKELGTSNGHDNIEVDRWVVSVSNMVKLLQGKMFCTLG